MSDNTIHTLVASSRTAGHFALDDADTGGELSSGQPIAVCLGKHWIDGRVEFAQISTMSAMTLGEAELPTQWYSGYYFVAQINHSICALMVGMQVILR